MFMTCWPRSKPSFPKHGRHRASGIRTMLSCTFAAGGYCRLGRSLSAEQRFALSDKQIKLAQNLRRPGGDRHRERAAYSRRSRNAMQNCGRPWSIRQQRLRCSASSAARRRTCSRCSMPSSRAPPGFAGLMTWCCDSRGNATVPRAHFGPIPIGRVEISIDAPQYHWMREHGALHIPDVRAQNDFPTLGPPVTRALFIRSPSSAGGTHWNIGRTSHRSAPLHPGADQAPRNLRRPGGHRHRERADCSNACSRTAWQRLYLG